MLEHAASVLASGCTVVLDGTFRHAITRNAAIRVGRKSRVPVLLVECHVDSYEQVVRLEHRYRNTTAASDGRPELLRLHDIDWEPVNRSEGDGLVRIDTGIMSREELQNHLKHSAFNVIVPEIVHGRGARRIY